VNGCKKSPIKFCKEPLIFITVPDGAELNPFAHGNRLYRRRLAEDSSLDILSTYHHFSPEWG
jgi:hypothetical protein